MGINGLLPLLKSIHKSCNLKKFEGKTIGVDAYGWLHRGTVACAMELAMGKPTRKFVDFAMHRVRMLQHFGVIPFLIFDGDYLPSKAATEADRQRRREESRRAGLELLGAGKTSQAYLELQKAVDVSPEMARQLIDELKKTGVQYIVAPYEADAQMVYLERKGIIDAILSEDSDLLVFGAKCLLTKLDQYGNCIEINKADFCACREISLTGWSDTEFRRMAILSGCDYLSSITNMGLKTAYRMVRKHKTIEKVIRMLQFDGKFFVPPGYLEAFYQAELTFLHQRVFCPMKLTLVLHTEPEHPIDGEKMPFIGSYVEPEIAQGVARGDLHPMTKLPIIPERKPKMAIPETPWAAFKAQTQQLVSSNDLKKGKPIDAFFKPKRIPLGELDPNCFTPSPSQQEALLRNPGPWQAIPTPRPYLNQPLTEPEQLPQSAPAATRTSVRGIHIRTPTISEPRPPKRARLCADIETIDAVSRSQNAELCRSRFFRSAAPESSPTVGKGFRSKRSKKQDITIFSDDSIEEAMLSLPDFDGVTKQEPKAAGRIPVFEEQVAKTRENFNTRYFPIPRSAATDDLSTSQDTTPILAPSLSANSSAEQPFSPHRTSSLPTAAGGLKKKLSFSPTATSKARSNVFIKGISALPASVSTRPSRIPLAVKCNVHTRKEPAFSTKAKLTPLQRLGNSAVNRSKLEFTSPLMPSLTTKSNAPRRSMLGRGTVPFPEVDGEKRGAVVDPASIPLPIPDETENLALSIQKGSEDLIIHDSEGEEGLSPCAGDEAPRIDVYRFLYAG